MVKGWAGRVYRKRDEDAGNCGVLQRASAFGTAGERNWGFVRGARGELARISTATRCSREKGMTK